MRWATRPKAKTKPTRSQFSTTSPAAVSRRSPQRQEGILSDIPLFDLTADGKFRLAYDKLQWILQKREGRRKPGNGVLPDEREPGGYAAYRGIWFVGRKKSTLCEAFTRWHIDLMPEAQQRFDALPSSFPLFRHVVWQDDGEGNFTHVGWAGMGSGISNGGAAVEGTSERDLGSEGTQTPENEKTRLRESITRVEAA